MPPSTNTSPSSPPGTDQQRSCPTGRSDGRVVPRRPQAAGQRTPSSADDSMPQIGIWRVSRDGNDVPARGSRRRPAEADKLDTGQASSLIVDIYLRNTGGKCPRSRADRPRSAVTFTLCGLEPQIAEGHRRACGGLVHGGVGVTAVSATPGRPATQPRSSRAAIAVLTFQPSTVAGQGRSELDVLRVAHGASNAPSRPAWAGTADQWAGWMS